MKNMKSHTMCMYTYIHTHCVGFLYAYVLDNLLPLSENFVGISVVFRVVGFNTMFMKLFVIYIYIYIYIYTNIREGVSMV